MRGHGLVHPHVHPWRRVVAIHSGRVHLRGTYTHTDRHTHTQVVESLTVHRIKEIEYEKTHEDRT